MNGQDQFEAELRARLQARAFREAPPNLLARGMTSLRHAPQRRSWLTRGSASWMLPGLVSVAVVAVTLLVLIVLVPLLPRPTPVGPSVSAAPTPASATPNASPTAMPSDVAASWPTLPATEQAIPANLDLAHEAFWTLWTPMIVVDRTLRVGTLDGQVTATLRLPYPGVGPLGMPTTPEPAGPAGGRVLYVTQDGQYAALRVVDSMTGLGRPLMETTELVAQIALDSSGSTAYYATVDRRTGAFVGVEAIATAGGEPRSIITPDSIAAPASGDYFPHLLVSTDRGWVVFAGCAGTSCDLYAARADGSVPPLHLRDFFFDGTLVGIAGDLLIGANTCGDLSCDGFVVDLRTGSQWPLGGPDAPFAPTQLIAGPHGPLVLGDVDDHGVWSVLALDLTDRSRTTVFSATFGPTSAHGRLADPSGGAGAAELPAGWFLCERDDEGAPPSPPAYSAATLGGSKELPLPVMTAPQR